MRIVSDLFLYPIIKFIILRDTLRDILRDILSATLSAILSAILSATLSNILSNILSITLSITLGITLGIMISGMPHYENEVPFEVPNGWCWCIVDDFAYVASGSTPSKEAFVEKGIPYIKMYNIRNQKIDFEFHPQFITEEVHNEKLKRSKTEVGDLIMNIVGPPLGKMAIIPSNLPESNFNQAAVLIRPFCHKDILVKYLFYYLSEMSEINSISTKGSAGQVNISLTQSQNMRIALPPLEEQKRIIAKVEELFSVVDLIDANSSDLDDIINKAKTKLLELAIHGKLVQQNEKEEPAIELLKRINPKFETCDNAQYPYDVPYNWVWCKLIDLCSFLSRGKSPTYSEERIYPVFAQKCNLFGGGISLEQARFLDPNTLPKWPEEYKLRDGDVLVNSTGTGTVGRTRLFNSDVLGDYPFVVPDSHVSVVRTFDQINSDYIYSIMSSRYGQEYIEDNLAGSTNQKELYIGVLENMQIPLPPDKEQQRISVKIKELFAVFDEIKESLEA